MLSTFAKQPTPALPLAGVAQPVLAAQRAEVMRRHHVRILGEGKPPLLLCNGFGCSQHIWNYLLPTLTRTHQVICFDQVGAGDSDLSAYDPHKYATLAGYAHDVVEICQVLELRDAILVGHSAGAMIGLLAAVQAPQYFAKAVLLAASPCYVNEPGYYGGFERADVLEVLASMDQNYYSWASQFADLLIGPGYASSVGEELTSYFCQADSAIARQFARVAYLADSRASVPHLHLPTLLVQCSDDVAVPAEVGEYLKAHLPQAQLVTLAATGHCPHLSAPLETLAAMQPFLQEA
ncbi:MAG: alpha/beta hydrolase [Hymenobacter sp.]|nr:MAG: alpha/beta hydrolase [Hymenobacter sp.]